MIRQWLGYHVYDIPRMSAAGIANAGIIAHFLVVCRDEFCKGFWAPARRSLGSLDSARSAAHTPMGMALPRRAENQRDAVIRREVSYWPQPFCSVVVPLHRLSPDTPVARRYQ